MTTPVNASLIVMAGIGLALALRVATSPLVRVALPPPAAVAATVEAAASQIQPDSLVAALVSKDPFRVTRRPSPVAYDAVRLAQPPVPPQPRPALTLVGIVWDRGTDPTALVDGLPGVEGPRPVRVGDSVGGLRVRAIKPDRVVITGLDTTWTLVVKEPWK